MGIELLIFDFDGTLFDTTLDIANAINYARKMLKMPPLDPKEVWLYTGDGFKKTVERSLRTTDGEIISLAYRYAMAYYEAHSGDFSTPVDNVLKFLKKNRMKKVILSNKNLAPMMKILQKFNISNMFDEVFGFESLPFIKPDKRAVEFIIQKYNINPYNVALIGDAEQDVLLAKASNLRCFIIPSKQIQSDDDVHIFKNYDELEFLLNKL